MNMCFIIKDIYEDSCIDTIRVDALKTINTDITDINI